MGDLTYSSHLSSTKTQTYICMAYEIKVLHNVKLELKEQGLPPSLLDEQVEESGQ